MSEHFNGLTPAQAERLAILAEEMGEAIRAVGKVLRHGYSDYDPTSRYNLSNRGHLEDELGDVRYAMIALCEAGDLNKDAIHRRADEKRISIKRWVHHQEDE